ncbi:MAG: PG0541 family transporter-associated protein [Pseudobdellovibrionaceae bacterium]
MTSTNASALMLLYDGELRSEIFLLLEMTGIKNYTQLVNLHGSSNAGKKEGSIAWPGTNEILLLIVSDQEKESLKLAVQNFRKNREIPPGLLSFGWKLEELF